MGRINAERILKSLDKLTSDERQRIAAALGNDLAIAVQREKHAAYEAGMDAMMHLSNRYMEPMHALSREINATVNRIEGAIQYADTPQQMQAIRDNRGYLAQLIDQVDVLNRFWIKEIGTTAIDPAPLVKLRDAIAAYQVGEIDRAAMLDIIGQRHEIIRGQIDALTTQQGGWDDAAGREIARLAEVIRQIEGGSWRSVAKSVYSNLDEVVISKMATSAQYEAHERLSASDDMVQMVRRTHKRHKDKL